MSNSLIDRRGVASSFRCSSIPRGSGEGVCVVKQGPERRCKRRHSIPYYLAVISAAWCPLGCSPGGMRTVPDDEACERRLERIWKGITDYHAASGHWPKDLTTPEGHSHSWRVLVAPCWVAHANTENVYATVGYRFGEAWDSSGNTDAIHKLPLSLKLVCPSESGYSDYPYTSYLMLKRPGPGDGSIDALPSDAVIVVESAQCGVRWAEPRDLLWDELWKDGSPFGKGKLHALHPHVVKALRADGKVIDIPKTIGKDDLRRLLNGSRSRE